MKRIFLFVAILQLVAINTAKAQTSIGLFAQAQPSTICPRSVTTISLNALVTPTGGSFHWEPAAVLNNPNIANPIAIITQPTRFTVTYTTLGTTVIDTVDVTASASINATPATQTLCANQASTALNAGFTTTQTGTLPQTFSSTGSVAIIDVDTSWSNPINVTNINQPISASLISSVCLSLVHTYDADLDIYLVAPNGSTMELSTDNGTNGDNYTQTCFSPTATNSITTGTAPFTGSFRPEGVWTSLTGSANGAWRIMIIDDLTGDTGRINMANITFVSGGVPITYTWSPSTFLNNPNIASPISSPTTNIDYVVTASDGVCTLSDTVHIIRNPNCTAACNLVANIVTQNTMLNCANPIGYLYANATGAVGATTFHWSNGVNTPNLTLTMAGIYTVTVTDASGCIATKSITVTSNYTQPHAVVTPNSASLGCGIQTVLLSASSTPSTATYTWAVNGAVYYGAQYPATSPGTYVVTARDSISGCTDTASVIVHFNGLTAFAAGDSVACNSTTGHLSATQSGGVLPFTYLWSNGATTASVANVPVGIYTVTITDATGCSGTAIATIQQNTSQLWLQEQFVNPSCGGANGMLGVYPQNGVAPYFYQWSNGQTTQFIQGLSAGFYTCIVTDANGCQGFYAMTLYNVGGIGITTSLTNANCQNTGGSATAFPNNGTAPYTYHWSNGQNTQTITNLSSGFYALTVTDVAGCVGHDSVYIDMNQSLLLTWQNVSNPSCGLANGTLQVVAQGGVMPITYNWTPNISTSNLATGLAAGVYTVTAVDASGCSNVATYTLISNDSIYVYVNSSATGCGSATGAAWASAQSPNGGNITYLWSNGSTQPTLGNLAAGVYTVTITNAGAGCANTATASVTVTTNASTTTPYQFIPDNLPAGISSTITVSGATGNVVTGSELGSVFANFEHSYRGDLRITLTCPSGQSLVLKSNTGGATFLGIADDEINNLVAGQGSTFIWNNNATTTLNNAVGVANPTNPFPNSGTNVSILGGTFASENPMSGLAGCPLNGNWTLNFSDNLGTDNGTLFYWGIQLPNGCGNAHNFVTQLATPAAANYAWSNGATGTTLSNVNSGNYSVTVSDAGGCSTSATLQIPTTAFTVTTIPAACSANATNGSATITINTPQNPSITWSTGATGTTLSNVASGWYSVTVTNGGCTFNQNVFIGFDQTCRATISGFVVNESGASNCIKDAADVGVPNIMIQCRNTVTNMITYDWTDNNGYYQFVVDTGRYEVKYYSQFCTGYTIACPSNGIINVHAATPNTVYANNNFYRVASGAGFNLSVEVYKTGARPGFAQTYNVYYNNDGTTTLNGVTLTFTHPAGLTGFAVLTGPAASYNAATRTATWTLNNLTPNANGHIQIQLNVPTSMQLGTLLDGSASISYPTADACPNDNNTNWTQTVTNSFDPNSKEMVTRHLSNGAVTHDPGNTTNLEYQIHFQNLGTDTATTVLLVDTLNLNILDRASIKFIASSHPCTLEWEGSNILKFHFQNINLPHATANYAASQGWVMFSADVPPAVLAPQTLNNRAAIYFDYNAPVITNTATTLLIKSLGVENPVEADLQLQIAPNPTDAIAVLRYNLPASSHVSAFISDVAGKQIMVLTNETQAEGAQTINVDATNLAAGIYMLTLKTQFGIVTKRLVKTQ